MVKRPYTKIRWVTSSDAGGAARYYPYHVQERDDLWSLHAELGHAPETGRFRLEARDDYRRLLDKTPKREYQDRLAALERGAP